MVKTTHEESDDSVERVPVGSRELPPVGSPEVLQHTTKTFRPIHPIGPVVSCKFCGKHVDAGSHESHWGRDEQGKPWKYVSHRCKGTHGYLRIHPKRVAPLDDVLAQWVISDWPCEALDGCEVEPDGTCEHGFPSWLVYLQPRLYID